MQGIWGHQDLRRVVLPLRELREHRRVFVGGLKSTEIRATGGANYDHQPFEARATVSACLDAYRTTSDPWWYDQARRAFEWLFWLEQSRVGQVEKALGD